MAGSFLQGTYFYGKRGGSSIDGGRASARFRGFFDFGDQSGANYRRVGKPSKNGNVAGKRNAEAHGDGELRRFARPPQEGG